MNGAAILGDVHESAVLQLSSELDNRRGIESHTAREYSLLCQSREEIGENHPLHFRVRLVALSKSKITIVVRAWPVDAAACLRLSCRTARRAMASDLFHREQRSLPAF